MPQQDPRARLSPKNIDNARTILGPRDKSNILFPLYSTGGVLFPYTPTITSGMVAEYDQTPFTHSIYGFNAYMRSYPKPIGITAEFTAQTYDEALYLLAVIHFFRSVTKSYFGINPYDRAGTPPPVLKFNYLGEYQYNNIPVIVKNFDFTYDANIDYVAINTTNNLIFSNDIGVSKPAVNKGGYTWVPTHMTVSLELDTQYTPIYLRDQFNLDQFRQGNLVDKGFY
jgi:hypothetical protein